jgi:hypothetical protein
VKAKRQTEMLKEIIQINTESRKAIEKLRKREI